MADKQPPTVVEGATTGDVEDELPQANKSGEDRKAASALASLDSAATDDASAARNVDQAAVHEAMRNLERVSGAAGKPAMTNSKSGAKTPAAAASAPKNVKVDAADVALLMDELDMTKPKATELLKAHEGDAVKALKAYVAVS